MVQVFNVKALLKKSGVNGMKVLDFIEENGFVTNNIRRLMLKILFVPLTKKSL